MLFDDVNKAQSVLFFGITFKIKEWGSETKGWGGAMLLSFQGNTMLDVHVSSWLLLMHHRSYYILHPLQVPLTMYM